MSTTLLLILILVLSAVVVGVTVVLGIQTKSYVIMVATLVSYLLILAVVYLLYQNGIIAF